MNWKKVFKSLSFGKLEDNSAEFKELNDLFRKYRSENIETDGDVFDAVLFEKLQKIKAVKAVKREQKRFVPVLAFSIAAALLIVFAVSFYKIDNKKDEMELVSSSEVAKGEPVKITIEFESSENIENVEVHFSLDEGVRFYSENEKIRDLNEYIRTGSFKKGINEIPFVVSLVSEGEWSINTETKFGGFQHNRKIVLKTGQNKTAVYIYKSQKVLNNL
ncbi:MAG TPA: hypothetical protein PKG52_06185 [bacterium]|nr:hypothetical protein [bacterium]HPS28624.1 hypothetical protein [bacterium]